MIPGVSHDREDESPEAKALWFQSLTVQERLELFDELTELALELNPELVNGSDAETPSQRLRVLTLPRR
ncbi:MAG: hypothetical protein ACM3JH_13455 [Acidithiobacillales bacterium]